MAFLKKHVRIWTGRLILLFIKGMSHLFYRLELENAQGGPLPSWDDVRLIVFLNHTSLYEVLFLQGVPLRFVWDLSRRMVIPGADKTLKRPLVGLFFKLLGPGMISITRKRDETWRIFMDQAASKIRDSQDPAVVIIAPEGRMKRPNGLDSEGRPMSVRAGVADVLQRMDAGRMMITYSGGLHHVQVPGQRVPRIFKKIKAKIEAIPIAQYKQPFASLGPVEFRRAIVQDLEDRMRRHVPADQPATGSHT